MKSRMNKSKATVNPDAFGKATLIKVAFLFIIFIKHTTGKFRVSYAVDNAGFQYHP